MKKIIGVLTISIILLGLISGLLFYQLNSVQNENSDLRGEVFDVSNRLKAEQNHTLELENQTAQLGGQIIELNNQISQLEDQITELNNQIGQFEGQIVELNNLIDQLELENIGLEAQKDELQNVIDKYKDIVNITEFVVYGFAPLVCLTIGSHANITIKNKGTNDVTNLTFTFGCLDYNDSKSLTIDIIRSGEEIQIREPVMWNLGSSPTWFATISNGDKIWDEGTAKFSP